MSIHPSFHALDVHNLVETARKLLQAYRTQGEKPAARWPSAAEVTGMIDHTLLKPEATAQQIEQLCQEALTYRFAAVCVNPVHVPQCAAALKGSPVQVATVVGFPLGATLPEVKVCETRECIRHGATEIDMVIDIGSLKGKNYARVEADIAGIVQEAHAAGALVKVIIETALLSDEEKVIACLLSQKAGADFVKTSTGFSTAGATEADVRLMRFVTGPEMEVKAAGGVRSLEDAQRMVAAGATRLGASAGVKIAQAAHPEPTDERPTPQGDY